MHVHLPHLLSASLRKNDEKKTVCILVATSGDTGKAALEGFKDVSKTQILVFYPKDGVSDIQQLQMVTQEGGNVGVCAVVGNFDDAQTGVKKLFADEELAQQLAERGYFLSSANSINWGRVLCLCTYGKFRQHSRCLLCQNDGGAHQDPHLRIQREQRAHGFPPHGCV